MAGSTVQLTVANPVPAPAGPVVPREGRGHGLRNLADRVAAAGGALEAGARGDGRFVVSATVGERR